MGLFDKVKTQASTLSSGLGDAASKIGGDVISSSKENAKLAAIKADIASIEGQLDLAYKEIGKKYIDNLLAGGDSFESDIKATLAYIEPSLEKKIALEDESIEIEKALKDQILMQEKDIFQREFDAEKSKLDKALKMDVISQEEYNEKLSKESLKLENFDQIRKVKKQYEMDLISKEEMTSKLLVLGD